MTPVVSSATRRSSIVTFLIQFVGNAAVFALAFFGLQIPDSHIWQLALSFLLAALLAVAFLWMHATTIRRLRACVQPTAKWLGMLLLAAWIFVYQLLSKLAGHISNNADQRAGYWNSQLSAHMRVFFTYQRLDHWQNDFVISLVWLVIPGLLLPFAIETVSCGPAPASWRNAFRCLFRWKYWFTGLVAVLTVQYVSGWIIDWHPLHTVRGELISVAARVGVVYVLDIACWLIVLAVTTELLARSDAGRNTAP